MKKKNILLVLFMTILFNGCAEEQNAKKCQKFINDFHNPYIEKQNKLLGSQPTFFIRFKTSAEKIFTDQEINALLTEQTTDIDNFDYKSKVSNISNKKDKINAWSSLKTSLTNIYSSQEFKEISKYLENAITEFEKDPNVCKNQKLNKIDNGVVPSEPKYLETIKKAYSNQTEKILLKFVNHVTAALEEN